MRYNAGTSDSLTENVQAARATEIFHEVSKLTGTMAEMADLENGYTGDHLDMQRHALRARFEQVRSDIRAILGIDSDPTDPFESTREHLRKLEILLNAHAPNIALSGVLHPMELDQVRSALLTWLRSAEIGPAPATLTYV